MFRDAGLDLEQLRRQARRADFRPVELKDAHFAADVTVTATQMQSQNVLAKLTGSKHPDETIMFAAHWDAYGSARRTHRERRCALAQTTTHSVSRACSSSRASSPRAPGRNERWYSQRGPRKSAG